MGDREYFLGLDMGTNSVGWAVTDNEYHLLRKKGKDLWGIREFDEAETAVNRRNNRVSRRRRQREKIRIGLLREFFDEEIKKVDPYFFIRLDNSKYFLEDKDSEVKNKNAIFNDADYTDVEYYKQFPTIFHLRKKFLYSNERYDIRLLYLAIANMFKRRGHFLNESLSSDDDTRDIQEIYDEFVLLLDKRNEEYESKVNITATSGDAISEILGNNDISRKQKSEDLAALLGVAKSDKLTLEYIKCLCGLKCDAKKLFLNIEKEDKIDICFKDFSYEDKIPELMEVLGDDNYSILEVMKQIYDAGILSGILKDANYLSDARVSEYEKHHNDLQLLKKIFKKYKTQEEYDFMFRSGESGSYGAYVNSYNSDKKQRRSMGGNALRNSEVLYKKIKNMLAGIDDKDAVYILDEIENERFLPKQLTSMNGVIPNQLHKKELKRILANAEKQFNFLLNKDEGGRTVSDRILALFSFQIPYYIGPVSDNSQKNGGNGWVVRKEEGSVLPWNIEEKIDVAKTSEEFIMRMVRNCTYLRAEKVLPKMSLEYERFCVLNEINNIRIDGDKLSVNMKQNIYDDLFKRGKKVSRSSLEKYLIGKGVIESGSQITGIDITINNSLSSYGKFRSIFGEDIDLDSVKNMVERIIFLGTVYGDSKKMFRQSLEKEFSNALSAEQLKRIIGYKFKDWGNLSKEFLELRGCNKDTGEEISLIRAMWESNNNMMELINSNLVNSNRCKTRQYLKARG